VARRLEIELTSNRSDGKWTWRAAGAKQPKGTLDGSLLPEGTEVGDVLKVEADATLDGLEITAVLPTRSPRAEVEILPLLGSGRKQPLVTSQLAPKIRSRARGADRDRPGTAPTRRKRADRGERRRNDDNRTSRSATKQDRRRPGEDARSRDQKRADRPEGRPKTRDKNRGGTDKGASRDQQGKRNSRASSQRRPKPRSTPRAHRLRPRTNNRRAALAKLPEIQHPLAEEVIKGGVPGLRKTIDRMNKMAQAEGIPKVSSEPLVALAEKLTPDLNAALWRDRAEAAIAGIDKVDLRDIRSVVVAADSGARDEESRELAEQLREGLSARVENEHRSWLNEIAEHLADGRTVRALRLSSHPPKAGAPLPFDVADRLTSAASESLSSDIAPQRWATVLDAVAFSPVRSQVTPQGCPPNPNEQLLTTVRRLASKVPDIAALFGITPSGPPKRSATKRRPTPPPPPTPPPAEPVAADLATAEPAAAESPVDPVAEEPSVEPVAAGSVTAEPAAAESPVDPVAEEPPVDPVAEQPVAAEPSVDSVTAEPVAEEPAVDPVAEQPVAVESPVDPGAEEPVAAEPVVVPVAVESPVDPVAEQPVAAEPVVVPVAVESPVDPGAEEPVADEVAVEEGPTPPPPSAGLDPTERVDK